MADDVRLQTANVAGDLLDTINGAPTVADPLGRKPVAQRIRIGHGPDGAYVDVDDTAGSRLPVEAPTLTTALGATGTTPPVIAGSGVIGWLRAVYDRLTFGLPLSPGAATEVSVAASAAGVGTTADLASANTVIGRLKAIANALLGTLSVTPTIAGDVVATLASGRRTVTTPGTSVALVTASTPCKWVAITALKSNTDQVNTGGTGTLATTGGSTGEPLSAGESVTYPVDNANKIFIDARVATEGVSYTIGA